MGNTIYKNIKEYKNGNKEIFREIINVFNPLINKLSKSVNGEDTRQDLLVHLLEIINKLPEENRFEDRKSTRLNSSHRSQSRMPSSA